MGGDCARPQKDVFLLQPVRSVAAKESAGLCDSSFGVPLGIEIQCRLMISVDVAKFLSA